MAYIETNQLQSLTSATNCAVAHFNARSHRKHYDEFPSFLTSTPHPFVAICVSETWLNASDKNLFSFPSYCPEYCHRTSSSYGGSAIFVLSSVKYKRRDDLNLNVVDCESVWVELDRGSFSVTDKHTIIGSIYRSTSSSVSNFCSELERILHSISLENKNVIIMGDININLLD